MGNRKEVANVGSESRGSELIGECGEGHAGQPSGKSIGATYKAPHIAKSGTGDVFSFPKASGADSFRGTTKSGFYRLSGKSGAHMIGRKKGK